MKKKTDSLQQSVETLQGANDTLEEKTDTLQGENDALRKKTDVLQHNIEILQGENENLQTKHEELANLIHNISAADMLQMVLPTLAPISLSEMLRGNCDDVGTTISAFEGPEDNQDRNVYEDEGNAWRSEPQEY